MSTPRLSCLRLPAALPAALVLAMACACARSPLADTTDGAPDRRPYPGLVPLEQITTLPPPEDPGPALQARAAALKARAQAIGKQN